MFCSMPSGLLVCVVVAFLFWGVRVLRVAHDAAKAWEMRQFFHHVLHIVDVSSMCFVGYLFAEWFERFWHLFLARRHVQFFNRSI